MRINRILAIAILSLATLAASAQSAQKLIATKANDYGLAYNLPITKLQITIVAEFTEEAPGEFNNYAKRYLNITDAIKTKSVKADVKSVTVSSFGVADPENRWLMFFKGNQNAMVLVNEDGMPLAINIDEVIESPAPKLPTPQKAQPTPLELPAARQAITQEMTLSASETRRAKLAADRIFELREIRNDLISGQAENTPPDGESMRLALQNLTDQENALTAMFAGTTRTWTDVITFTYTPGQETVKGQVISRLSPIDGFVDADDLSGAPIYLSMTTLNKPEMPLDEKGVVKPFPKNGIAYMIPGSAQFDITYDGRSLWSDKVELAQLGYVYGLDPKLFTDKKTVTKVLFNPTTGAIQSIDTEVVK